MNEVLKAYLASDENPNEQYEESKWFGTVFDGLSDEAVEDVIRQHEADVDTDEIDFEVPNLTEEDVAFWRSFR